MSGNTFFIWQPMQQTCDSTRQHRAKPMTKKWNKQGWRMVGGELWDEETVCSWTAPPSHLSPSSWDTSGAGWAAFGAPTASWCSSWRATGSPPSWSAPSSWSQLCHNRQSCCRVHTNARCQTFLQYGTLNLYNLINFITPTCRAFGRRSCPKRLTSTFVKEQCIADGTGRYE